MISDKEKQLLASLDNNKEYREALAIEHVNTTLAIQIRKMRENRQWSQSDLAGRSGKHQETISQWENPDYGRHSITTLKALAATFDVALLVKFIPFSELVKDMVSLSETRLSPPSFVEEQLSSTVVSPEEPTWLTATMDDNNLAILKSTGAYAGIMARAVTGVFMGSGASYTAKPNAAIGDFAFETQEPDAIPKEVYEYAVA